MVARKPGSPGRARRKPLKPFAQGRPGVSGEPVVTTLVCFVLFRTRGCGCALSIRLSLRPLLLRGATFMHHSGASALRERRPASLRGAQATKQSRPWARQVLDCFASLAMTVLEQSWLFEKLNRKSRGNVPSPRHGVIDSHCRPGQAQARPGTHNHRYEILRRLWPQLSTRHTSVVMGPRLPPSLKLRRPTDPTPAKPWRRRVAGTTSILRNRRRDTP